MRFKEIFNNSDVAKVKILADIGSASFDFGKTDKNQERTPTYEIEKCLSMFELNSLVASGVEQLMLFLFPDSKLIWESKDEKSKKFMQEWSDLRPAMFTELKLVCQTNLICGNGPAELYFTKEGVFDNVFSFNNASSIYKNPNDTDGSKAYILKISVSIHQFFYRGKLRQCAWRQIRYAKGSIWFQDMIWGIYISDDELYIYKSGWSRDNLYGRSILASSIDAVNVMNNIISSWDTISKTKQIDHKIITPETKDGDTVILDDDTLEKLADQLNNTEGSYSILGMPFKLLQTDIKTSGNYDLMEGVFELLRRSIMLALLPNHLTTWADTTTTQGAETSMPSFLARLESRQKQDTAFINDIILSNLRKTYDWLADDLTVKLGKPKVRADEYYIDTVIRLVEAELISKQEAKDYLFTIGILDIDIFDEKIQKQEIKEQIKKKEVFLKGDDKPKEPLKTINNSMSFLKENLDYDFDSFKRKLNRKYKKKYNTKDFNEIISKNLGGHNVRLIEDKENYFIFDGLNEITKLDKKLILKPRAINIYKNVLKSIEDSFNNFLDDETKQDKAIKQIEKQVSKLIDSKIKQLFKLMSKHQVKKENYNEAFLGFSIMDAFKNLFKGFTQEINDIVTKTTKDLGIEIINDKEQPLPKDDKKKLKSKHDLMLDSLKDDIKKTSDDFLVSIKRSLSNGIAAGKKISDIKKDVEKATNYRKDAGWKFDRVVRTTTRQINGLLTLQKMQMLGFETFIWKTKGDSKVRPSHAAKNNKVFKIKDALNSDKMDAYPGKDFNCRCIAIPHD